MLTHHVSKREGEKEISYQVDVVRSKFLKTRFHGETHVLARPARKVGLKFVLRLVAVELPGSAVFSSDYQFIPAAVNFHPFAEPLFRLFVLIV